MNLLLAIPERVTIFRGIVAWLGLPTRQISFEVPDRPAGESKWSLRALGRLGLDMITGLTNAPLGVLAIASIGFVVLAGLLSVQTLYVYLTGRAVEGFTTVILTVLITGAALSVGWGSLESISPVSTRRSSVVPDMSSRNCASELIQRKDRIQAPWQGSPVVRGFTRTKAATSIGRSSGRIPSLNGRPWPGASPNKTDSAGSRS